jgi:hypothetical protein
MSKINSFALVIIIAISLASCSDKSKNLLNTWRIDNAKFSKTPPPQMMASVQSDIEHMKAYWRTTYNGDGTEVDVRDNYVIKATWDLSRDGKVIYSTDERGRTTRFLIRELTNDKFVFSALRGNEDTLTYYMVPFSAKDTLNRKPLPPQMMMPPRGQAGPPQQQGNPPAAQQGNAPAKSAQPAAPTKQK